MWRTRDGTRRRATCPACGRRVTRDDAREYDKYGDRWDREEKTFEYVCRPCHHALCHQRRRGLEAMLVDIEAGEVDRAGFFERYARAVERRSGRPEEP